MADLSNWIDKSINEISATTSYDTYFRNIIPREDEGRIYLSNKNNGIDLVFENERLQSIHFFSGRYKESKRFLGELPMGIEFSFSRAQVQELFGVPNRSGGGFNDILFGNVPIWDKYFFSNFTLHFQYSADESQIDLITIGSLSFENYLNIGLQ